MEFTHEANPVRVNATRILEVTGAMFRLEDGRNYEAQAGMLSRYEPVAGDYLVTQEDGYEYFNPKDVFERKYRSL
jgi:hypothetical protein